MRDMVPELINSLRLPEHYPHPVDEIEVIETHISWLLLTGDYAYKIKKPVNFGFLDFTTLGKTLSVRSFARLGSSLSVVGMTRLGSSLAILDFVRAA